MLVDDPGEIALVAGMHTRAGGFFPCPAGCSHVFPRLKTKQSEAPSGRLFMWHQLARESGRTFFWQASRTIGDPRRRTEMSKTPLLSAPPSLLNATLTFASRMSAKRSKRSAFVATS